MRRTSKSLLISALVLFAAGLILALSAALFVKIKGIDAFGVQQKTVIIEDKVLTLTDVLSNSPDSDYMLDESDVPFSKVELHSFAGNLVVRPSDGETKLSFEHTNTNNISYEIVGDTLIVKEVEPIGFFGIYVDDDGFSYKGLRQLFGPGNSANSGKTVTLYLDPNLIVESLVVKSKIGDVTLDAISAQEIEVDAFYGKVNLLNLQNSESKVRVNGTVSKILLSNSAYASCNLSSKIGTIEANLGDFGVNSTVLDVWTGKVFVKTVLPTENYKLSLTTTVGSIMKNGELFGKTLNESSTTTARISSTAILGDIVIESLAPSHGADDVPQTETQESSTTQEQEDTATDAIS